MFLLPDTCVLCRRAGPCPCSACAATIRGAPSLALPTGLDALYAGIAYEANGRRLVSRLKYWNRRGAVDWLADRIVDLVLRCGEAARGFDCVTWVPSSATGLRHRGYDPGRLLAKALARRLGLPCRRLLVRTGRDSQRSRSRRNRLNGPSLVPLRRKVSERSVLLIDDVCTTGASLSAAARTLRSLGVQHIVAGVGARTPLKSGGP